MLSFPIADKQEVYGVINVNSTTMKTFSEDEIHFVSHQRQPDPERCETQEEIRCSRPWRGLTAVGPVLE